MISVIINAILVGISVWLTTMVWHTTGVGLVLASVLVHVVVRLVAGFALMGLNHLLGRNQSSAITWS